MISLSQSISQLLTKGILSNGNKEHVKYIFYYTDMGHSSYQLHFLHISMAIYFKYLKYVRLLGQILSKDFLKMFFDYLIFVSKTCHLLLPIFFLVFFIISSLSLGKKL